MSDDTNEGLIYSFFAGAFTVGGENAETSRDSFSTHWFRLVVVACGVTSVSRAIAAFWAGVNLRENLALHKLVMLWFAQVFMSFISTFCVAAVGGYTYLAMILSARVEYDGAGTARYEEASNRTPELNSYYVSALGVCFGIMLSYLNLGRGWTAGVVLRAKATGSVFSASHEIPNFSKR